MPEGESAEAARSVRVFVAVPRDPAWSESARAFVETLRPASPDAAWTRPAAWHLTIKFLGNAPAKALEIFARALEPAATALPSGTLTAGPATVFPPRGPARVLGLGFERTLTLEALETFAAAAELEARSLGLQREERPFHPHVTFARLRSSWPPQAVERFRRAASQWRFPEFPVRACVLYASRLEPGGAVHTPIAEWPFAGAGAGATA